MVHMSMIQLLAISISNDMSMSSQRLSWRISRAWIGTGIRVLVWFLNMVQHVALGKSIRTITRPSAFF